MAESNVKGLDGYARQSDVLVIAGDGRGLFGDYQKFLRFGCDYEKMCLGRSPQAVGSATHYAAIDWDQEWYSGKLLREKIVTFSHFAVIDDEPKNFNVLWPANDVEIDGGSGLFAISIGLLMGFDKIVLVGIPLDEHGHWYNVNGDPPGPIWTDKCLQVWQDFADKNKDKVRSMSGRTAKYFGKPDAEWLKENEDANI